MSEGRKWLLEDATCSEGRFLSRPSAVSQLGVETDWLQVALFLIPDTCSARRGRAESPNKFALMRSACDSGHSVDPWRGQETSISLVSMEVSFYPRAV